MAEEKTRENKHQRFRRIAAKRVDKVMFYIDQLERCSARLTYEYGDEDVARMLGALDERVAKLRKAFAPMESFEPMEQAGFSFE